MATSLRHCRGTSLACGIGGSAGGRRHVAGTHGSTGAPAGLRATIQGTALTLAWNAPLTGDPVAQYIVRFGSAPGGSDIRSAELGPDTTATFTGRLPGRLYVRVRGRNAAGTGPESNEVTVIIG